MSLSKLRFYLDENMDPEISEQLRRRGIDVLTARDVRMLKRGDQEQLRFAIAAGRVMCTEDSDFTEPSFFEIKHFDIAYFPHASLGIGYAVNALLELHRNETAESMENRLVYL